MADTKEPVPINIKSALTKCNLISSRFGLCAQDIKKATGNKIKACNIKRDKIICPIGTS